MDNDITPSALDPSKSSPARVYDALLGGKDNYAVDREAARTLATKAPEVFQAVRANRAFLVRAVRYLADAGIRHYIDLGSGLPTAPNVHQVACEVHPDARVAYVDNDPVVVAHGRALNSSGINAVVQADLRDPDRILEHPDLRDLIDLRQPVGVLAVAVLHFLDDHDSVAVVSRFREVMAPGSYLVISHASPGTRSDGDIGEVADTYREKTTAPLWIRTPEQIRAYFTGLDLVDPGLVPVQDWGPDPAGHLPRIGVAAGGGSPRGVFLAGVARVPGDGDD